LLQKNRFSRLLATLGQAKKNPARSHDTGY
jgi:hypothetical protein